MTKRAREIRSHLVRKGVTETQIAKKLGISQQMVSAVIYGKKKSLRVEQALVAAGVPKELIEEPEESERAA